MEMYKHSFKEKDFNDKLNKASKLFAGDIANSLKKEKLAAAAKKK
jgi:hypothetical protein